MAKTPPQETPSWKFSDLKVSWTLKPASDDAEGVRITGPAFLFFLPSIDQKKR